MTFSQFESRWMDLFLAHKISGFTCFTMEELFLSISVQLDIIKQTEKGANPKSALQTRQALKKVSMDLDIPTVNELFEKMRNDIVHEGKLSGSNFQNKTKSECSAVIADLLNWLDEYTAKVCFFDGYVSRFDRWKAIDIEHGLPSFSCISSDLI